VFDGPVRTDVVLTVPADAAAREALLDRLARLAATEHDGLDPVGAARTGPAGTLHVARGGGVATDMATVLSVRGRCSAAESSGVLVALAGALAALHDAGLVHGPLAAGDVVVDLGGRPRLRPRPEPPAGAWEEADDVHALAGLVASLTVDGDGDDVVALRAALAPALAADPRVRPEAGTLAARAHDAVASEPVHLPEPATLAAAALGRTAGRSTRQVAAPGRVRHRRARRAGRNPVVGRAARRRAGTAVRRPVARGRVLVGAAGVALVVGLLVAGGLHLVGPAGAPATAQAGTPLPESGLPTDDAWLRDPADPAGAAEALTARRVALLAGEGSVTGLAVAGSPAAAEAAELVAGTGGVEVVGPAVTVHDARVESGPRGGTAVVAVDYVVEAHEQRAADGTTTQVPAGPLRTAVLDLRWTDAGWRVSDVG
jgi:hypothetical protein